MKRELHTLYIKHDSQFKTLSKIALSQLILKIVYLKGDGTKIRQIETELSSVLSSPVSKKDVEDAIRVLVRARKLNAKSNRYFIHNDYKEDLTKEIDSNKELLSKILDRYFSKAESNIADIENWFNDSVISFFEKYSFEWFQQVAYKGKNGSNVVPNIHEILDAVLLNNTTIRNEDKEWLKGQFIKFIDSEDAEDNLLFWYYGISMFSSRLITARNYADGITIDMFRDSKFILDTNILMILDLEEHELSNSLESLETIFEQLNITTVYLHPTRDEYLRAMDWRRTETTKVFDNFQLNVLKSSDCPFIQTALRRGCSNGEDVKRMFESLMDLPSLFNDSLPITNYNYSELSEAIESGENNDDLKTKINETYKKRTGRDKRERPVIHDAGIISGAQFIRKTDKCWIITSDSTMKRFAIEHCIRDENEIAVGLDVVIGLMAVNSGGVNMDASNFAPLFKNLIKYSLVPESDAFEVKDLAFILRTNIKVNELPNEKVIEVAKEVKRLRIAGEEEENVALYLRRFMEGDTVGMVKEVEAALSKESIAKTKRDEAERERDVAYNEIRDRRRGELRDEYDTKLRNNRLKMIAIPVIVGAIAFFTIKYGLTDSRQLIQYLIGCSVELIFGLLPLIPLNKRFVRKHSEYVNDINRIVENEIMELKKKAS
jgi:rRNA-processing protein FCF1